jgi:hypothetical protein
MSLAKILACAGQWNGKSTLQDPHNNIADECASTLTITPILKGTFVRIDYTWSYQGATQEGIILVGFEKQANAVTAHWADTWHMSDKAMTLRGGVDADGTISVLGSYAAPPGPDWGWRIVLSPGESFRMTMYNIWPEGKDELAVTAVYTRSPK